MKPALRILLILCLGTIYSPGMSQVLHGQDLAPTLSAQGSISLITMWPGKEIYIAFGHSAFRVQDPSLGLDEVYNYGTFYLDDPLFVPKFVQGELNYVLGREPFERQFLFDQRYENRKWYQQELNLNNHEINKVYAFLYENAKLENRTYRYDFVWDNCATRPRDVLRKALGDSVRFAEGPNLKGLTFRQMLDEYLIDRPMYHFGITLLLGSVIDRQASAFDSMFLPHYLMWEFDRATIIESDGSEKPLVAQGTTILNRPETPYLKEKWLDPAVIFWPLFLLVALFLLRQVIVVHRGQALKERSFFWRFADFLWYFIWGLFALIVFYVALPSTHNATKENWTLLWFWPSHILAAVFVLLNKRNKILDWYFLASAFFALIPLIFWPLWPQAMHPAQIPFMLIYTVRGLGLWHRGFAVTYRQQASQ